MSIRDAHAFVDTMIALGLAPSSAFEVVALGLKRAEGDKYVPFGRLMVPPEGAPIVVRERGEEGAGRRET